MALRADEQTSTSQGGHTVTPVLGARRPGVELANCGAPWCPLELVWGSESLALTE